MSKSKNARTAKSGFDAEHIFCSQKNVVHALETYFGEPIKRVNQVPGRKKTDVIVEFASGVPSVKIQIKNGCNGRGWSVDRRHVDKMGDGDDDDDDANLKILLNTLCLKDGSNRRPQVSNIVSERVLAACMLGGEEEFVPDYFVHTTTSNVDGKKRINSMSICSTRDVMLFMYTTAYTTMLPKRTCVHINPCCYLQRKGGGKTDHSPDDIQMKVKFNDVAIKNIFVPIV